MNKKHGKHGEIPRGLTIKAIDSPGDQHRFGRMFPKLAPGSYGNSPDEQKANLTRLAAAMVSSFDAPKDGKDDEESGIPALYTYFGQFVDHDLTFDPDGSFQKKKDPTATFDFRTPAFDMDNIYGRGPGDQPYLYDDEGTSFLLGDPLTLGKPPGASDLQRNSAGRALIGDPRNDENAIVSQLQGLVLHFHNRVVREKPDLTFEQVQQFVQFHYQYVVVNDFLPRIVKASVLDSLKSGGAYDPNKLKVFKPRRSPFMPVEFSVAAYRLGHSMIRPGYRLNDATLVPIFPNPKNSPLPLPEGLTGFRKLISDWGLDWGRFIDTDIRAYDGPDGPTGDLARNQRLQFAYRIDTAHVEPLANLPASVVSNPPPSLILRNLQRGVELGLPTGQAVANALGEAPLPDEKILIGQGVDTPDQPLPNITSFGTIFKANCPLWTYILAEAMQNQIPVRIPVLENKTFTTPQLGPVGGRIVAEVFLGLLFSDELSYLKQNPTWTPPGLPNYQLKDFVKYALGQ